MASKAGERSNSSSSITHFFISMACSRPRSFCRFVNFHTVMFTVCRLWRFWNGVLSHMCVKERSHHFHCHLGHKWQFRYRPIVLHYVGIQRALFEYRCDLGCIIDWRGTVKFIDLLVVHAIMMSIFSLSRDVDSWSGLQDLGKDVLMIFCTSPTSTTPKFDREGAPCDSSVACCETVSWRELPRHWRIVLILFAK